MAIMFIWEEWSPLSFFGFWLQGSLRIIFVLVRIVVLERDEQGMGQRLMYWTLWVSHTLAAVSVLLHNQASY